MRKIGVASLFLLLLILGVWFGLIRKSDSVFENETDDVVYRRVLKQPVTDAGLKWQLELPDKVVQKSVPAAENSLRVEKAHSVVSFSFCSDASPNRTDYLAQRFSAQKSAREGLGLLSVDCGMIKTSIPLSF